MSTQNPEPGRGVQPHEQLPPPLLAEPSTPGARDVDARTLRYDAPPLSPQERVRTILTIPQPPYRTKPSIWRIAFGVLLGLVMFALLTLVLAVALWGALVAAVSDTLDAPSSDTTISGTP